MIYGENLSAINSLFPVSNALKKYFAFSNTVQFVERKNYSTTQWHQLLFNELNSGRPIEYAGVGTGGGHAFVCDGYDNNGYFHFNWGWSGSQDGHFLLGYLNPNSGGAGAGDGGFNSYEQAVIGIQPGINFNINLALYSDFTISPKPISYGQAFNVNVNIVNNSSSTFNGDYAIGIFNVNGAFIDFVETKTNQSLPVGYQYTGGLTFSNSDLLKMVPGNYYLILLYRPNEGEWSSINNGGYLNYKTVTVNGPANDLKLYDSIRVSTRNIVRNQPFNIAFDLANYGTSQFNGEVAVGLYKYDGTFVKEIGTKTGLSLNAGNHFANGLSYSSAGIDVEPGNYLLLLASLPNGGNGRIVGSGTIYPNPITVKVESPPTLPDIYENNNVKTNAYALPLSFSGYTAVQSSVGSNLHIGTDVDYYKVVLPLGYSYDISARVHDGFSTVNGQTYSADVLFSIESDTSTTDVFDDVMPTNYKANNGGILYFKVAPFFSGLTGTYLLDLNIIRHQIVTSIDERLTSSEVSLFPNPAKNELSVLLPKNISTDFDIEITNQMGQPVFNQSIKKGADDLEHVNVSQLLSGIYYLHIKGQEFTSSLKFLKHE